jgi:protein-tyrosine phosphatase
MIDIHSHILPLVDDGPSEIEESIRILEKGEREGISTFVLTPHLKEPDWNRSEEIMNVFAFLQEKCSHRGMNIKLILGAEIYIIPDLHNIVMNHPFATFGGKRKYVLVELPVDYMPNFCEEVFFELLLKGITPILAHVERYVYFRNNVPKLTKWSESGILFQLNAGSLTGRNGWFTGLRAKKLLKTGLINFIASDVHAYNQELSLTAHAFRIAANILGDQAAEKLKTNPEYLLSYL